MDMEWNDMINEINKNAEDLMTQINLQLLGDKPIPPGHVFALAELHKQLVQYLEIAGVR